jgi:Tol biopolymer transport system component
VSRDSGVSVKVAMIAEPGSSSPVYWSPARDELVAISAEGLQIFSAQNNWKQPVRIVPDTQGPVVFSDRGDEIVYPHPVNGNDRARAAGAPDRTGCLCRLAIHMANAKPRVIASVHLSGLIPCAWSSATRSIIYWFDKDFSGSLAADGLDLFQIADAGGSPKPLNVSTLVDSDLVALSPDETSLAITAGTGREEWERKRIATIDLRTTHISYLTEPTVAAVCPAWSPNGNHIAFSSAPSYSDKAEGEGDEWKRLLQQRRIWICESNGTGNPRQLTNDPRYRDEEPAWCRAGTHILFCRIDLSGNKSIWLLNLDGNETQFIAGPLARLPFGDAPWGYYGYITWRKLFDWHHG